MAISAYVSPCGRDCRTIWVIVLYIEISRPISSCFVLHAVFLTLFRCLCCSCVFFCRLASELPDSELRRTLWVRQPINRQEKSIYNFYNFCGGRFQPHPGREAAINVRENKTPEKVSGTGPVVRRIFFLNFAAPRFSFINGPF